MIYFYDKKINMFYLVIIIIIYNQYPGLFLNSKVKTAYEFLYYFLFIIVLISTEHLYGKNHIIIKLQTQKLYQVYVIYCIFYGSLQSMDFIYDHYRIIVPFIVNTIINTKCIISYDQKLHKILLNTMSYLSHLTLT